MTEEIVQHGFFPVGVGIPSCVSIFAISYGVFTSEIEGEDPNNYTGFLLIHDKLAINILISVGLDQFGNALSKSLSDTPGNADGLVDALVLCKCGQNG